MKYRMDADVAPVDSSVLNWLIDQGVNIGRTKAVEYDSEMGQIMAEVGEYEDGKLVHTQDNQAVLHPVLLENVTPPSPEVLEHMRRPPRTVNVAIPNVPAGAIADALIAIERARDQGVYDAEQIERLDPLVKGLRNAR